MDLKPHIIEVTRDNLFEYPHVICFINPKHPFYRKKIEWLEHQFDTGLRIKLLFIESEKKPVGFIEYVPGEHCWRAVNAAGYLFIHCLWTNGKKYQHQGLGSMLIRDVEKDAKDCHGVVTVTSDKAFMSTMEIFLKNGYQVAEKSGKEQLMIKQFKDGSLPSINPWEEELKKARGFTILYSRQCPWVARFVEEVKPVLEELNLSPTIIEIKTAKQAQQSPSLYSVFSLIYNGKLLADRYISVTRFRNIVKKQILV